jgi:hypothetical protein
MELRAEPARAGRLGSIAARLSAYFLIVSLAPHKEHLPSAVIFGCSFTSPPHMPHLTMLVHLLYHISLGNPLREQVEPHKGNSYPPESFALLCYKTSL